VRIEILVCSLKNQELHQIDSNVHRKCALTSASTECDSFFENIISLSQTTQITENCFRVSELILLIHLFWKQKIMFFKNESYTVLLLVEPHFV